MALRASDIVPISEARARLTELAEDVVGSGSEKVLTKNGASYVALVDARRLDYYHALESEHASLVLASDAVAGQPERLAGVLDLFFKMERVELLTASLREGVRRYQSTEIADEIAELLTIASLHRDKLRRHLTELADHREQVYRIADEEAQRCRGVISRQGGAESPAAPRKNRK